MILSFPVSSKYDLGLKMQKIVDSLWKRKIMACYMTFFSNVIISCPGRYLYVVHQCIALKNHENQLYLEL